MEIEARNTIKKIGQPIEDRNKKTKNARSRPSKFKEFFEDFDSKHDTLGISGYGISVTTLEEVFLKAGHQELKSESVPEVRDPELDDYSITEQSEGGFSSNCKAMMLKRFML